MDGAAELIHATAIACSGKAVLIRGPSGSGKSDLALRCLALAPTALLPGEARLISDDQVHVRREGNQLIASAPAQIAGQLEIRGLGIIDVKAGPEARVVLVADLVAPADVERHPDPWPLTSILGIQVPVLRLWPYATSAHVVLLKALTWDKLPTV